MEWSNEGTSALRLRLVRSEEETNLLKLKEKVLINDFSPAFVYPIFGEEETIFGYKDLEINLRFSSGSLKQYLSINYSKKFPETSTSTVLADDPEKILYEFIPPNYSKNLKTFSSEIVEKDSIEFKPIGKKIASYRTKDRTTSTSEDSNGKGKGKASSKKSLPTRPFEMIKDEENVEEEEVIFEAYASDWETPGFKEFHRRMQIFVLLYIEGGSTIDEEDLRWEFITLFERRKRSTGVYSYHFVGYVSFYSFFCWPDTKRLRLAQFIILPPYQGEGHGSALYTLSYQNILSRPEISELTVEDPSETFEDMRDKCDLFTLIPSGEFEGIQAPIDKRLTEVIRKKFKIADRQFYRLLEMILLLSLDTTSAIKVSDFRLTVKRRLYLFNKEMLLQIEQEERKVKLQETFEGVQADYRRLTESFA